MNERIKELMKEAQVIYDYAPFYGDMDRDPKPLYKLDPEKFAELIVRECAEKVDWILAEGGKTQGDLIKEHFGVE
jgi:hypothetical protein